MKLFIQLIAIGIICAGCATTPKAPPSPAVNVLRHRTLVSAEGQSSTITKGQVTVTVAPGALMKPVRYICEKDTEPKYEINFGAFLGVSNCPSGGKKLCFDRIKYPCYKQSDEIYFDVSIKTNIPKPVRLADSFIAFRTGDEQIPPTDYQESYNSFQKGIILPGSVFKFVLHGPDNLLRNRKAGENVKIVLGLYDIVVEMDDNSVATKKAQFEYTFNYSYTEERKEEPQEVTPMVLTVR